MWWPGEWGGVVKGRDGGVIVKLIWWCGGSTNPKKSFLGLLPTSWIWKQLKYIISSPGYLNSDSIIWSPWTIIWLCCRKFNSIGHFWLSLVCCPEWVLCVAYTKWSFREAIEVWLCFSFSWRSLRSCFEYAIWI